MRNTGEKECFSVLSRSDVWSFGISMIEIATFNFPYQLWATPVEQLKQVSAISQCSGFISFIRDISLSVPTVLWSRKYWFRLHLRLRGAVNPNYGSGYGSSSYRTICRIYLKNIVLTKYQKIKRIIYFRILN
jgi:serine/threonine protein kinase